MTTGLMVLFAIACGISVANLYYVQPLLPAIVRAFHVNSGTASLVVTGAQIGYLVGLALLVPLGDMLVRRRLVPAILSVAVVALIVAAASPNVTVLIAAMTVAGLCSVSAQILVPFAAHLADDRQRGRVVGVVVSGLLLGILLARTVAGLIAQLAGWRAVYLVGAAVVFGLTVLLASQLPGEDDRPRLVYRDLLRSVVGLMRTQPLLRLRSLLGALIFAAFNVLWTSLAFLLAKPPYSYGVAAIGLFGLLGAGGAVAASYSGRLADRGYERLVTGGSLLMIVAAFGLLGFGAHDLVALLIGIFVADLGIQSVHVQNQQLIFAIDPAARSRLNTGYMVSYFIGGAIGSTTTGVAYGVGGWSTVVMLGIAFSGAGLVVWVISQIAGSTMTADQQTEASVGLSPPRPE